MSGNTHEAAKRLLGRLAPGAIDMRRVSASTAPDGITPSDIAGALGLIGRHRWDPGGLRVFIPDRLGQALLLYMWAGHDDLQAEIIERGVERMATYGKYAWVGRVPTSTVHRLLSVALQEAREPDPCRECSATGWGPQQRVPVYRRDPETGEDVYLGERWADVPCDPCKGRGAFAWTIERRVAAMGCSRTTWAGSHRSRYDDVQDFLSNREAAALGRLIHRLRGERDEH
jgi:hypothetical protein